MNKGWMVAVLLAASGAVVANDDGVPPGELHRNMLMTGCIHDEVGALAAHTAAMSVRSVYQFEQETIGPAELRLQRGDGTILMLGWNEISLTCAAEIPYGAVGKPHFPALLAGLREAVTHRYGEIVTVEMVAGGGQWRLQTAGGAQLRIELVQAARAIEMRSVTTVESP